MRSMLKKPRPLILALTILVGVLAHGHRAHAETAIVAGGCFWCVEADFEKVEGVSEAISGFAGGDVPNPTYRQVTRGGTGHVEAVQIEFDASVISYGQILDLFLRSIDPLDDGGQFCDRGFSYTPAIFPIDAEQRAEAEAAIARAEAELGREVRVPVRETAPFYPADAYHQDYYKQDALILTRFGPQTKAAAYEKYRDACRRDERVRAVWGESAPFAS